VSKYLIDSNILIYTLRGINEANAFLNKIVDSDNDIYFSFITRLELMCEKDISAENKIKIDNLLSQLIRIDYNYRIEEQIIALSKFKKMKIPDAIIAASALFTDSTLVTRNTKDFQGIPDLRLLNPFEKN